MFLIDLKNYFHTLKCVMHMLMIYMQFTFIKSGVGAKHALIPVITVFMSGYSYVSVIFSNRCTEVKRSIHSPCKKELGSRFL